MALDHIDALLEQWRREAPKLDHSPVAVIGRISRLARLLEAELETTLNEHGLNAGEFSVLTALRRAGRPSQLSPSELSRGLLVTSGGMTKRLATLERRGLIKRAPAPDDGRSSLVVLTHEGKRVVDETLPDHLENEARLLASLPRKDREDLARLLRALALSLGDRKSRGRQSRRRTTARAK